MAYSKIQICNMALASLGASSIRSFDEGGKKADLSLVFYDTLSSLLLSKYDWGFARRLIKLRELQDYETPPGIFAYQVPSDCKMVRDLYPRGTYEWWDVMGSAFLCRRSQEVYVYYTKEIFNPTEFSDPFVHLLALSMAVKMSPGITQDTKITDSLFKQLTQQEPEAITSDAVQSNTYPDPDNNPMRDSFVQPDGWAQSILNLDPRDQNV